jgi:hypothetical protein
LVDEVYRLTDNLIAIILEKGDEANRLLCVFNVEIETAKFKFSNIVRLPYKSDWFTLIDESIIFAHIANTSKQIEYMGISDKNGQIQELENSAFDLNRCWNGTHKSQVSS